MQVCCSLGLLTEPQAKRLKAAGVDRINHNLNTSEAYHSSICTTHTYQDRVTTLQNARAAGLELCSGGIVGMGESDEDLVDLAFALQDVNPDSIPLNMLHPIPGTPLADANHLTPQRCLKILCLFRFIHPRRELRAAGGREFNLRSCNPWPCTWQTRCSSTAISRHPDNPAMRSNGCSPTWALKWRGKILSCLSPLSQPTEGHRTPRRTS